MDLIKKSNENPILIPDKTNFWESEATFNPGAVIKGKDIYIVYRAVSGREQIGNVETEVSSVGVAKSRDGVHFTKRYKLFGPEHGWERFGCEDPRITKLGDKYYIFYTALSDFPFRAEGIRVGLAITKDLKRVEEKHLITPFNAKAMALFPGKVSGQYAAVLTVHTDRPPAKVCIATFDKLEELWDPGYWDHWYAKLDSHVVNLQKSSIDQVEVGAPPLKTSRGWLLIHSYIENYFSPKPFFTARAALLNLKNPREIIGRSERTILAPNEEYEEYGKVPNVVFPSGAVLRGNTMFLYYGASDTTCALAKVQIKPLVEEIISGSRIKLHRFKGNPILSPIKENDWESRATFNPAAIYLEGKIHLLYRAMSADNTSTFGYASTENGLEIKERLSRPVYSPRESFEAKMIPGGNSGCEDPRITDLDHRLYVCYTAYNGKDDPRVALTSISKDDFLNKNWNWDKPKLISPPGMSDKDTALFPRKINGKYVILHRLGADIWIDYVNNLDADLGDGKWLGGKVLMSPRPNRWDSKKIGIAGPPIETKYGWLLLYHGISKDGTYYRAKAALLDLEDPSIVKARTTPAILEPEMGYEKEGEVRNVVFPCGAVVKNGTLLVYYGGADKFTCVASIKLQLLLNELLRELKKKTR